MTRLCKRMSTCLGDDPATSKCRGDSGMKLYVASVPHFMSFGGGAKICGDRRLDTAMTSHEDMLFQLPVRVGDIRAAHRAYARTSERRSGRRIAVTAVEIENSSNSLRAAP